MTRDDGPGEVDVAVIGAVAYDEIHSAAGDVEELLGGSAVHTALAASLLARCAPISAVGDDFDWATLDPLRQRGIELGGVERAPGQTFRWGCRYAADGDQRETLYTRAGVYDTHPITIAPTLRRTPYLLLTAGNPEQNERALAQMPQPRFTAIDTIEREVVERRDEFLSCLDRVDMVSINALEAAHLIGWQDDLEDPSLAPAAAAFLRERGVGVFALKRASQGVELFHDGCRTHVSTARPRRVIDPTGAGDAFIGAMLSAMACGRALVDAARWGCAVASFTIEDFGIAGILGATRDAAEARLRDVAAVSAVEAA